MSELSIPVDRASPVPLYFQVAQRLETAITSGELPPGSRLDNEIAFADRLGLSRPTMRRAIQYLVEQGLLVRKRGVGTQVVHTKVRRSIELTSLHDDLAAAGQRPRTDVLYLAQVPADADLARALQVPEGSTVTAVDRLRYAGEEPLALMHNDLPIDIGAVSEEDLRRGGLYALLRGRGMRLRVAAQTIGARAATAEEARQLGERRGTPLLTMTRTTYDDSGRIVEASAHLYRASLYAFEMTLVDR